MKRRDWRKQQERVRLARLESRDFSVPACGAEKQARIDLGLVIFSWWALPGVCYTQQEIAVWCGCTSAAIQNIERKALRKLRNMLMFRDPELAEQLRLAFFDRRQASAPKPRAGCGG